MHVHVHECGCVCMYIHMCVYSMIATHVVLQLSYQGALLGIWSSFRPSHIQTSITMEVTSLNCWHAHNIDTLRTKCTHTNPQKAWFCCANPTVGSGQAAELQHGSLRVHRKVKASCFIHCFRYLNISLTSVLRGSDNWECTVYVYVHICIIINARRYSMHVLHSARVYMYNTWPSSGVSILLPSVKWLVRYCSPYSIICPWFERPALSQAGRTVEEQTMN